MIDEKKLIEYIEYQKRKQIETLFNQIGIDSVMYAYDGILHFIKQEMKLIGKETDGNE